MNDSTPKNIPNPDPSLATNERLAMARSDIEAQMHRNRDEGRRWIEQLQLLLEEKIKGAEDKTANLDRVVQTRLAGSETALNAAMAAADKVTQKQADNFDAVLNESKIGLTKQIDNLNEKIDGIKMGMSESGGRTQGIGQMATMIIAAIAAVAATVAVIITLTRSPAPATSNIRSLMGIAASLTPAASPRS